VKHLGGFGASFLNDVAGPNREFVNQSFSVSGAYNFHLTPHGNSIVALGVQGGLLQQRVNYDALQWSTQYSPISGFDGGLVGESGMLNEQVFSPVLNLGVMWFYTTKGLLTMSHTTVYNGMVVANLIKPSSFADNQASNETLLLKVHGGLSRLWNRKYEISPNYLVQYQQDNLQVNVGAYFGYYVNPPHLHNSKNTKITIGAWYRLQDAFILSTGFSNRSWNFGFSYDANVSSLSRNLGFGSAYEISLAYKIVVDKGFKRFSSPLI
jgi:type IX secretion system PorP/SprF family membrane protein